MWAFFHTETWVEICLRVTVYLRGLKIRCHQPDAGGQAMSDEELKTTLEALEKVQRECANSPEKAHAFLVEAGFVTPEGELTENYRQGA
jgi:hypothetical protein